MLKKTTLKILLASSLSSFLISPSTANDQGNAPLQSIASLDLNRYQGTWYEIAKYPNSFQKKCVGGNTRAEYTLLPEERIQVVNRCRLADGTMNEGRAIGRKVSSDGSAKLEVNFAPKWLSFLPFVWGNYWVIDLDPEYQLAAVSEPKREYLWVLSRTKKVDPKAYEALIGRLKEKGFDPSKLELTEQSD